MEYKCEFCNKTFSTKSNLNAHVKTTKKCIKSREGQIQPDKSHPCNYCLKVFGRKDHLQNHLKLCFEKIKSDKNIAVFKLKEIEAENLILKNADIELIELRKLHEQLKLENTRLASKNLKLKELLKDRNAIFEETKFQLLKHKKTNSDLSKENEQLKKDVYSRDYFIEKLKNFERPTQTINNNFNIYIKLSEIEIENSMPLTTELINEKIKTGYLYRYYANGYDGLNDFTESIVIANPKELNLNPWRAGFNYVCVDPITQEFYRLNKSKKWKQDTGAKYINIILDALKPSVEKHQKTLEIILSAFERETDEKFIEEVKPIHSGILDAEFRPNLFGKVKEKLSEITNINKILKTRDNLIMNS